jgi:starch-binding outer membrane protein, SusD/RagB family
MWNFKPATNMKTIKYFLLLFLLVFSASCNEEEWLNETPLDFYAPDNSFVTEADFTSAIARLYENVSVDLYDLNGEVQRAMYYPTDIAVDAIDIAHDLNSYKDKLFPNRLEVQNLWSSMYGIVFDANVIIERIENEKVNIASETKKNALKAEAMFFRAFAYRVLGTVYGGVPIVLEEITSPKRDFVRASRDQVWAKCVEDLAFATQNLPEITNVAADGRISKAVAWHLLSEIYLNQKNWDSAIDAATQVISNPNFQLMTQRFGKNKDQVGDPYSDLFKRDNQNRSSGNREGLWVNQYEYLVTGGGTSPAWPRFLVPLYWQLKGPDNVNLFTGPNTQFGGRGIGWYAPTPYMQQTVWQNDFKNDLRNAPYAIIRDIKANNPASPYFGRNIVESGAIAQFPNTLERWWNVIFAKVGMVNEFPDEFVIDPATGLLNNSANNTFTDNYVFRLAETYLLRAEAYLGKGDKALAAADINAVRSRSKASAVAAVDVTLDYILDERARELCWEELRLLTLMRTEKLVERVRKYNPVSKDFMLDHQNLWPIPAREIETNTEAKLEQNPGYN